MDIQWQYRSFDELSVRQLYDALALRESVFSIEQRCTCQDIDKLDIYAIHLLGYDGQKLIAYARILPPNIAYKNAVSFGRLLVEKHYRRKNLGKELTKKVIDYITQNFPNIKIEFSAQLYLQKFYEDFGFIAQGDAYEEAGIPHIKMISPSHQASLSLTEKSLPHHTQTQAK